VIRIALVYGIVAARSPTAAYHATKAALINLTRHLATAWVRTACGSMRSPLDTFPPS
jgi:NAD(P)-dependent dehydrogenase (short-subunit alcohol dehydrogenase family)